MFFKHRVQSFPVAIGMQALGSEVVDEVERDEVSLYLPILEWLFAKGAFLADHCPILDADVAEGVSG